MTIHLIAGELPSVSVETPAVPDAAVAAPVVSVPSTSADAPAVEVPGSILPTGVNS